MRRYVVLLIPALLAGFLGAAPGDAPPPADLPRLIDQLGDPDFQQRERASALLRQQGIAALPALRAAVDHPDAEVRRRVLELVPALETAVLISPRRVSLTGANRTVRQLIDDLAKQTGYGIDCWGEDAGQKLSLELHDVTFWEALDRVSREAGLVLQPSYGSERLRLAAQNVYSPHIQHQGAFRLAASSLTQVRTLDLALPAHNAGPPRRSNSLAFSFSVSAEPRLPVLAVGEPHVEAAYDSERNSLLPPLSDPNDQALPPGAPRRSTSARFGNRSHTQQVELSLIRPSEKAGSIKLIRGTIPLTLLVSQKQVLLTDKPLETRNKKVVVDRITFVVEEVTQLPSKQYQVRLAATDEGDGSLLHTLYQRIEILDTRGNKMMVYSSGWSSNGGNNVHLTMTIGAAGGAGNAPDPPGKISFQSWNTLVHHVEFEFRDIPLP